MTGIQPDEPFMFVVQMPTVAVNNAEQYEPWTLIRGDVTEPRSRASKRKNVSALQETLRPHEREQIACILLDAMRTEHRRRVWRASNARKRARVPEKELARWRSWYEQHKEQCNERAKERRKRLRDQSDRERAALGLPPLRRGTYPRKKKQQQNKEQ